MLADGIPRCRWVHRTPISPSQRLVVGPVIGVVTDTSARILAETGAAGEFECRLTSPVDIRTARAFFNPYQPSVFRFDDLLPSQVYVVEVVGFSHVGSSIRTLPHTTTLVDQLVFGVFSCNKYRLTKETIPAHRDVWQATSDMVARGELHVCIHIGDQIYADDSYGKVEDGRLALDKVIGFCAWAKAHSLLKSAPPETWDSMRNNVCEIFRDEYRAAWSHPPTSYVLANCINLMQYDDHEIQDDLGDRAEHRKPGLIRTLVECGRQVAQEYQRQIYHDIETDVFHFVQVNNENRCIYRVGQYGILLVDTRGEKLFNPQASDPYPHLTSQQWADIKGVFQPGGFFDNCHLLVLCTQIPPFFFGPRLTNMIVGKADDFEGHWTHHHNVREMIQLLNEVYHWKIQRAFRDVVIAGGDMHLGGFAEVYKDGLPFCTQLLCGPVANRPPGTGMLWASKILQNVDAVLPDGWSYYAYGWFRKCNVGIIRTSPQYPCVRLSHLVAGKLGVKEVKRPTKFRGTILKWACILFYIGLCILLITLIIVYVR